MEEERRLILRMLKCGMGQLIPRAQVLTDPAGQLVLNGWMAVPTAPPFQRLICDRRPSNCTERSLGWARLARGAALTRLFEDADIPRAQGGRGVCIQMSQDTKAPEQAATKATARSPSARAPRTTSSWIGSTRCICPSPSRV